VFRAEPEDRADSKDHGDKAGDEDYVSLPARIIRVIPTLIISSYAVEKFMRVVPLSIRLQSAGTWSLNMLARC